MTLAGNDRATSNDRITVTPWGEHDGKPVVLITLKSADGAAVQVTNYGATLVSATVPDRQGNLANVILGFDSLDGYVHDTCYLGSTIGRIANRIGGATFMLDGQRYTLDNNDNGNTNHGGKHGFNTKVFEVDVTETAVIFSLVSKAGEGGFPGTVTFFVTYSWTDEHALKIRYRATTDSATVLNITNHAYFNLAPDRGDIGSHTLFIAAKNVLETNAQYIPTGKKVAAARVAFEQHRVGEKIVDNGTSRSGVNHYYILDRADAGATTRSLQRAAVLREDTSGRSLEVFTTYPGVQCYTGDFLSSTTPAGNPPRMLQPFDGLCLECQHYPDAPNHATFPSVALAPGKVYDEMIVYNFRVDAAH